MYKDIKDVIKELEKLEKEIFKGGIKWQSIIN